MVEDEVVRNTIANTCVLHCGNDCFQDIISAGRGGGGDVGEGEGVELA